MRKTRLAIWEDGSYHAVEEARRGNDRASELRNLRGKSLILLRFWRGFRSDELSRLRVEHIGASAGEGIRCFLARTKGDRQNLGRTFRAPALSRLCPVDAYLDWVGAVQLTSGPVYRAIDRWGHIGENGLNIDSITLLLRATQKKGGLASAGAYSGHSLRRVHRRHTLRMPSMPPASNLSPCRKLWSEPKTTVFPARILYVCCHLSGDSCCWISS